MRRCPVHLSMFALLSLLIGPLALGQTAPGTAAAQEAADAKILRLPWWDFPETLDPQRSIWGDQLSVSGLDYEGLTRIDEEMNTVPGAAESWAFSEDGLVLTFTLRDNLTYADGSPLTAERFRYAVERTCDPETAAPLAIDLFAVAGCEAFATGPTAVADPAAYEAAQANLGARALDERMLELRLAQPAAYLPTVASTVIFSPVKQEDVEADPEGWWRNPASRVGNGPFHVVAVEPDREPARIRFAANERYWGGRPKLDGIDYLYCPDSAHSNTEVDAYRRAEWTWPIPGKADAGCRGRSGVERRVDLDPAGPDHPP